MFQASGDGLGAAQRFPELIDDADKPEGGPADMSPTLSGVSRDRPGGKGEPHPEVVSVFWPPLHITPETCCVRASMRTNSSRSPWAS
jgi:hypothetical protein